MLEKTSSASLLSICWCTNIATRTKSKRCLLIFFWKPAFISDIGFLSLSYGAGMLFGGIMGVVIGVIGMLLALQFDIYAIRKLVRCKTNNAHGWLNMHCWYALCESVSCYSPLYGFYLIRWSMQVG
eukprot:Lankesteria_metandrocarpae@DN4090_c0_g1_i1.p1